MRSLPERSIDAEQVWAPGPPRPLLAEGAVHVWRADLEAAGEKLTDLLSAEERARAERLLGARARCLWARGRGLLRALLARYLDGEAQEFRFALGPHGKPELLPPRDTGSGLFSFNLSHSGGLALYALASAGAVGVDVELARASHDVLAIAARFLGEDEAARLRALEPPQREREFLRGWTRHEAELKLHGLGIGGGPVPLERRAWIGEIDVGELGAAALALGQPPRELRLWDWSSSA